MPLENSSSGFEGERGPMICYNICKELYSALCCLGGFHVNVGNLDYLISFRLFLCLAKRNLGTGSDVHHTELGLFLCQHFHLGNFGKLQQT